MKHFSALLTITILCHAAKEQLPLVSTDDTLHTALTVCDLKEAERLLTQGVNPNKLIDNPGLIKATPLYLLVSNYYTTINEYDKKKEALILLCKHGADINYGGISYLKYLGDRHPMKKNKIPDELCPLSFCIRYYSYAVAAVLMHYGADVKYALQHFDTGEKRNTRLKQCGKSFFESEALATELELPPK